MRNGHWSNWSWARIPRVEQVLTSAQVARGAAPMPIRLAAAAAAATEGANRLAQTAYTLDLLRRARARSH